MKVWKNQKHFCQYHQFCGHNVNNNCTQNSINSQINCSQTTVITQNDCQKNIEETESNFNYKNLSNDEKLDLIFSKVLDLSSKLEINRKLINQNMDKNRKFDRYQDKPQFNYYSNRRQLHRKFVDNNKYKPDLKYKSIPKTN